LGIDAHTFGDLFENGTAFENKRKKLAKLDQYLDLAHLHSH
jgi:hypothetical protein